MRLRSNGLLLVAGCVAFSIFIRGDAPHDPAHHQALPALPRHRMGGPARTPGHLLQMSALFRQRGEDAMTRPATLTQADIARAIRAADACGKVAMFEKRDG